MYACIVKKNRCLLAYLFGRSQHACACYLVCESLREQRQRVGHKVKLLWGDALAAVSRDGQSIPLGVYAEELQVHQTVCHTTLHTQR